MARPVKSRVVYSMPATEGFMPLGYSDSKEYQKITMTVDEYEAIRIIDLLGLTQEECAESMGISRPTVTNIYESARHKIADAMINEKILLIGGGSYNVYHENKRTASLEPSEEKIRIAVSYEDGSIFQHFGRCSFFKVYDVENGEIVSSRIVSAEGYSHSAIAGFLNNIETDILICGGIGKHAKDALDDMGITLFGGVTGKADQKVDALLKGKLEYNDNVDCTHKLCQIDGCTCSK